MTRQPSQAARDKVTQSRIWLKHYDSDVPPSISYPRIPVHQLLEEASATDPEAPCTNFFGKRLTFRQIDGFASRFAAALRHLGVQPGDRVALLLPNSPQFLIAYYGALKAGAVVVPLNPLYTEHELAFHFADSGAETAVTVPMFLEKTSGLRSTTPLKRIICCRISDFLPLPLNLLQGFQESRMVRAAGIQDLVDMKQLLQQGDASEYKPVPTDPDEVAVLIYSGGTTGIAKGIMLSHSSLVANAYQIAAWGGLGLSLIHI